MLKGYYDVEMFKFDLLTVVCEFAQTSTARKKIFFSLKNVMFQDSLIEKYSDDLHKISIKHITLLTFPAITNCEIIAYCLTKSICKLLQTINKLVKPAMYMSTHIVCRLSFANLFKYVHLLRDHQFEFSPKFCFSLVTFVMIVGLAIMQQGHIDLLWASAFRLGDLTSILISICPHRTREWTNNSLSPTCTTLKCNLVAAVSVLYISSHHTF